MKKVFLGLTAATILYAIYNVIIDIRDGVFDGLTIGGLLFLLLVAGVFGFLAWLFDGKSPVKRTAEQAKNVVKQEQEKFDAYVSYSPAIKRRIWKFRIIGLVLVALAVWLCIAGKCIASTSPGFIVLHIPSFALLPAIHIRSYCIRKKAKLLSTCCHRRIFVVRPFGAENPS